MNYDNNNNLKIKLHLKKKTHKYVVCFVVVRLGVSLSPFYMLGAKGEGQERLGEGLIN